MIFLVTYKDVFQDVNVQRFADEGHAKTVAAEPSKDPRETSIVLDTKSSGSELSLSGMAGLFNAVKGAEDKPLVKFENRTQGRERLYARLEAKFGTLEEVAAPVVVEEPTTEVVGNEQGEKTMAKTATKKKEPKVRERRTPKSAGQPVGKVADFRPIRDGSMQAKILTFAAKGGKTVSQIASHVEQDEKYIMTALYCINRATGIGYGKDDEKITITFPGSKTIDDAIKAPVKNGKA